MKEGVNYFDISPRISSSTAVFPGDVPFSRKVSLDFKTGNLLKGWTTAAHEYGHTLGLDHPRDLDIRGKGVPGIMYPRGTLVDAEFQYDPSKPAGVTGGTMHPMYRKVKQEDIDQLRLHRIDYSGNRGVVGQFSNVYHWNHAESRPEDFFRPPVFG